VNQTDLEERLILAAKLQADRLGWQFDTSCLDGHLIPFIKEGVHRLNTDGLLEDEAQIALAEANIIRFVSQMAIEAPALGLTELHEPSFLKVRDWFCPCFPFC
jgi:hypothetical protein